MRNAINLWIHYIIMLFITLCYNVLIFNIHRYGQGSGQIHITELECSRNDIHILHCNIRNRLRCDHSSDVAVICCKSL